MPAPPSRRTAKTRPLNGLLVTGGRRETVVVTAHEKRLLINTEADIAAIPLHRVRRDDGLGLRRADQADWHIRFDTPPPPDSWVLDLPLLPPSRPLRRALLILLGLAAAGLWLARDKVAELAAPLLSLASLPEPVTMHASLSVLSNTFSFSYP